MLPKDKEGFVILPPGREWRTEFDGRRYVQRFTSASMDQFANFLSGVLSQPVTNMTGLTAKYDFILKFLWDRAPASSEEAGPTLFEAVQSQLGLRLERSKSLTDVLVVDHIERSPTEN
jgi:uncharacterized protein (TIGR03435 family)